MSELLRPRLRELLIVLAVVALIVGAYLSSDYISGLVADRSRMQARIGALENRPLPTVTVSPGTTPSSSPTPSPTASPTGTGPQGSGSAVVAAGRRVAPPGRDPESAQPPNRDPNPPAAADSCPNGRVLTICLKASLLGGRPTK